VTAYSGDGWAVYLIVVVGSTPSRIDLTESTETPGEWKGEITPNDSEDWAPAIYSASLIAEKDDQRFVPHTIELIVAPNPLTGSGKTALQTELDLVNEAIIAVLKGKGVKSYQVQTNIGNRQLERMSLEELKKHRSWVERRVNQELIKMGLKSKNSGGHRIVGTRFNR